MANWPANKCGNCNWTAPGPDDLPIVHCDTCGKDMCPKCFVSPGGTMCKACVLKDPRTVAFMQRKGLR